MQQLVLHSACVAQGRADVANGLEAAVQPAYGPEAAFPTVVAAHVRATTAEQQAALQVAWLVHEPPFFFAS